VIQEIKEGKTAGVWELLKLATLPSGVGRPVDTKGEGGSEHQLGVCQGPRGTGKVFRERAHVGGKKDLWRRGKG